MTEAAVAIFTHLLTHERIAGVEVAGIPGGPEAVADLVAAYVVEPDGDGYRMVAWARERFPLGETTEPDPEWIGADPQALVRRLRRRGKE